jgi:ATPase family associated with various cellular activities (AAA)
MTQAMSGDDLRADLARAVAICDGAAVAGEAAPRAPGLVALHRRFGLSPTELDVVRIALAVELDGELVARHPAWGRGGRPPLGALQRLFAAVGLDGHGIAHAVAPGGHLVRHGVLELIGDGAFPTRRARLPACFWPRLVGLPAVLPFPAAPVGAVKIEQLAEAAREQIATLVRQLDGPRDEPALVVVTGAPDREPALAAAVVAGALGYATLSVAAAALDGADVLPALARESIWLGAAVVVEGAPPPAALARLLATVPTLVIVVADAAPAAEIGPVAARRRFDLALAPLTAAEALGLWQRHLEGAAIEPGVDLALTAHRLGGGPSRIAAMAALAVRRAAGEGRAVRTADLRWAARLGQASTSGLVQRLEADLRLTDVVVPLATRRELELARTWARHGAAAFRSPAAGRHLRGDAGLVCLFHGPPGTGKTMAARALAGELELELLRVDLSQVVNKYIGETEKNLARVFDEADATGAALFFDEADALFGKRSEVKDAHDRYANIETAFLLQRLEGHRGLCILASNLRQNLDDAFTRRIQIVAEFLVPGPDERLQIWERHLVVGALAPDVELAVVARQFALAGGDIRNAAASALLMATAEATPLAMRHLAIAIWRELRKSGRLTTADDFGPWRDVVLGYTRDRS